MKHIIALVSIIVFLSTGVQAQRKQRQISGNYTYQTECMGVEMDGSQTLKTWGAGKNRKDAVEQAKKNAVRDVLFVGIRNGKQECNQKPVIFEVNAQEKYEDYFNAFFSDEGPYKEFISMKDESFAPMLLKDRKAAGSEVTYGVIVRVMRAQLKSRMLADKIINP